MNTYNLAFFLMCIGLALVIGGTLMGGNERKSWVSDCTKARTFEACNQDYNALQSMDKDK